MFTIYHCDPKILDRQVCANGVDPDDLVLVWFLFYGPSTHFRSIWAWSVTLTTLYSAHSFSSTWQLLFLKRENGRRNFFMTTSPRKNVPCGQCNFSKSLSTNNRLWWSIWPLFSKNKLVMGHLLDLFYYKPNKNMFGSDNIHKKFMVSRSAWFFFSHLSILYKVLISLTKGSAFRLHSTICFSIYSNVNISSLCPKTSSHTKFTRPFWEAILAHRFEELNIHFPIRVWHYLLSSWYTMNSPRTINFSSQDPL